MIQLDILPTALAAAGIARPDGLDGVDLRPFLARDRAGAPHEALYWRFGQQRAIRMGDWKLVEATGGNGPILIDLAADLGEQTDRSSAEPATRARLEQAWKEWNATLVEPRWGRQGGRPAGRQQPGRRRPPAPAGAGA